jgi:anthranilate phosphoribosyltransferase
MSDLQKITGKLIAAVDLTAQECISAAELLPLPEVDPAEKKAFLVALHNKGESVLEVTAFAKVFRNLASDPQLSDVAAGAIDIVGTGGSGSKGFNISSVTAFIVAASGTKVLKHGNRAITSQSGSADFLSQHGIRMDTDPALLRAAIEELNFCFFFAPAFHPAFKEIMPVRKELAEAGQRTIFNILGPLINPAKPAHQLLGVFNPDWVGPLAGVLGELGLASGMAVCSALPDGGFMDELTTAGPTHLCGFGRLDHIDDIWTPESLGFPPAPLDDLRGGTADTLALNAAAAFLIVEKVDSIAEGCALAREIILGGKLRSWLDRAHDFYSATQS